MVEITLIGNLHLEFPFRAKKRGLMRTLLALLLWCILLVLCWPLAIAAVFLFPLVWLLLLPFRLVGFTLEVVFRVIRALIMLPFRAVGIR